MMEIHHKHSRRSKLFFFVLLAGAVSSFQLLPLGSCQLSSVPDSGLLNVAGNVTGSPWAVYIVHVRRPERNLSAGPQDLEAWHRTFLPTLLLDSGEPRMVYSYDVAISGFAARLTTEEAEAMRARDGVLAVHPDEPLVLQTTYTPDFMGLRERGRNGKWLAPNGGDGVIIGVVDSGVNPKHVSFREAGMPNPPAKWAGHCEFNGKDTCNNKLIGAKNYDAASKKVNPLPYDTVGHGTHVAGTASGGVVDDADIDGLAMGAASGVAPKTHLAVYKVSEKTSEALAAVNQAIKDGVDILSMSLYSAKGGRSFYDDNLAIAALSAAKRGILVSACAANFGPEESSIRNDAPWFMTVGATTTDRILRTTIVLGDNEEIRGESIYTGPALDATQLVYPGKNGDPRYQACSELGGVAVSKMIVLCHTDVEQIKAAKQAQEVANHGGKAMILMNSERRGNTISGFHDELAVPTIRTDYSGSSKILNYVLKGGRPTARVSPSATAFNSPYPFPAVAFFSGRGPSTVNGGILKPDVVGPGVNILAASSSGDTEFVFMSGTSMATPHLSGVAAILKSSHPDWTPAMIKSALMTTASTTHRGDNKDITDEKGTTASLHAMGSGQVNPLRAVHPGLVYKLVYDDYLKYLCGRGYSDDQMKKIAPHEAEDVRCAKKGKIAPVELNYPSIWVTLKLDEKGHVPDKVVTRTLTRVESTTSGTTTYTPKVQQPPSDVVVNVAPKDKLVFDKDGDERSYSVTFKLTDRAKRGEVRGRLTWRSSKPKEFEVITPLLITIV